MHLIVIADSDLCEACYILDHHVMDMTMNCADINGLFVHIITDNPSNQLQDFCNGQNHIKLTTFKEAQQDIHHHLKVLVVHFGKTCSFLKTFPHYFLPIITPNERAGISVFKRYLLNRQFGKWIKNATKVISLNDWSLQSLLTQYPNLKSSLVSLQLPIKEQPIIEWSEMSAVKEIISKGNNYLLIFAGVENITSILKEFSLFKKWQQSTMQLVFILENVQAVNKANSILKGYKFKQDVSIYTTHQVNATWLAASYLTVFEGVKSSCSYFVMHSIHFGVPLLFDDQIQLTETWKSAGEVFSFAEKNVLSNHFKLYYKDEVYRQSRATMGGNWLQTLNHNRSTFELFNNIVLSHIK